MAVAAKTRKIKKSSVTFWFVKLHSQFRYNGKLLVKVRRKLAMDSKGQFVSMADADLVELV